MASSMALLLLSTALGGSHPPGAVPAAQPVLSSGDTNVMVVPTISLGDGTILGSRLRPFQTAWSATFYPDQGAPIVATGMWLQSLQLEEYKGRKVFVRATGAPVYSHADHAIRGYIAHIAVLDAKTLAPIWSEHHDIDGSTTKWIVDGTHVEWHHKSSDAGAKEEVETFETPVPAYDFDGAIIPFYLRALPLKVGYSGVIPEIGDPKHPLRGLPFKVVRRERIKAGLLGMVDAWVVECPDPTAGTLHFWFSPKVSYPLKMEIPETPGVPRQSYDLTH